MGIRVTVRLYNRLQLLLPPEAEGETVLELPVGSRVQDVYGILGISRPYPIALNGVIERDPDRVLKEGDKVSVFSPVGGG